MNLTRLLPDTVSVASPGATDRYGVPTLGTVTAVGCRLEYRTKRVVDAVTGQEVLSEAQFVTLTAVAVDARVWLPGRDISDPNQAVIPKTVRRATSLDGRTTLYEVYL